MKKAASILYLISGILGIIGIITMSIFAAITVAGQAGTWLQDLYNETAAAQTMTFEEFKAVFQIVPGFLFGGTAFSLVLVILNFVGFNKTKNGTDGTGIHVANLIFSIFGGGLLSLIGSILGLAGSNE